MPQGNFEGERMKTAFPLLKFENAKMHWMAGFCIYSLKNFPGAIPPDSRKRPGVWTRTPISAWLASVPVVFALRNDHWYARQIARNLSVQCTTRLDGLCQHNP